VDLTNTIALAFALAFDAFAVAVAVGIRAGKLERWAVFRLSFHFGFAQFGMPIIGWRAGELVFDLVGSAGQWLAGAILLAIGARLIWEQFNPDKRRWSGDPTRGASLLALMFATSVDALAAGLSLALVGVEIYWPRVRKFGGTQIQSYCRCDRWPAPDRPGGKCGFVVIPPTNCQEAGPLTCLPCSVRFK